MDVDGAARTTVAGGVAYQASRFRVDLAGGVVIEPDRTVPECNPDLTNPGCPPGSGMSGVNDREQPDPGQPSLSAGSQFQSPYNGGDYSSGYFMFSLGVTTWF